MTTHPPQTPSIRVKSNRDSQLSEEKPISRTTSLMYSPNMFAAGIGEVIDALVASSNAPNPRPIMVEFGNRMMAIGRQRMLAMNGRNALLYMKSKFGLLNSTTPLFLQATFEGNEEQFVEVDLDSWEELVVYMIKLRIIL